MNIDYTYEIVEVDAAAKCMVVVYSAEGHETMQIGAPLPFEGECNSELRSCLIMGCKGHTSNSAASWHNWGAFFYPGSRCVAGDRRYSSYGSVK
jgi:hypothetical protein